VVHLGHQDSQTFDNFQCKGRFSLIQKSLQPIKSDIVVLLPQQLGPGLQKNATVHNGIK
jgi:hypothetical protein